jgi:hypothetical protein
VALKSAGYNARVGDSGARALGLSIAMLRNLTQISINLEMNNVSNDGAFMLGSGLGAKKELTSIALNLSMNSVADEGAQGFGSGLRALPVLTALSLDFHRNAIGSEGLAAIGNAIGKLVTLTEVRLDFTDNKLSDPGMQMLGQGLGALQMLTFVSVKLRGNEFGGHGCGTLAAGMENCTLLTSLSLHIGSNRGDGVANVGAVGSAIGRLEELQMVELNLREACATEQDAFYFGEGLGKLSRLTSLTIDLGFNAVLDVGAYRIGSGLALMSGPLTTLYLNLKKNQVGMEGGNAILKSLAAHGRLVTAVLNLAQNLISNLCLIKDEHDDSRRRTEEDFSPSGRKPKGSLELPASLVTFSLNLESNNIAPLFAELLGAALKKCPRLQSLTLDFSNTICMHRSPDERNAVLDGGAAALARGLAECEALELCNLNLQGNAIEDTGAESFAKAMDNPALRAFQLNLQDNPASSSEIEPGLLGSLPHCEVELTMGVSESMDNQPTTTKNVGYQRRVKVVKPPSGGYFFDPPVFDDD